MRQLIRQMLDSVDHGRTLAYCRLVETRGSTPQKAGAAMLVFADGSQAGTLGGGCVEAEVKRRALAILDEGPAEVVKFQLDSDYGWDDGLICGGRMHVLIEPVRAAADVGYYRALGDRLERGEATAEAIVFKGEKSGLAPCTSFLFDGEKCLVAQHGAEPETGVVPNVVREALVDLRKRPRPYVRDGISYLPHLGRCRLLIVGGGHVGQAVAGLAVDLDFEVWVVDDRADMASPERFPRAERCIHGEIGKVLADLEITPDTYCLIVTRGHNHDEEALYHLVDRGAHYVGMIGSRRKIKLIFDDLEGEGISSESLARVFAPVGIDIGSQTVPEIAVSIVAELVAHRNRGEVPGRPSPVMATDHA